MKHIPLIKRRGEKGGGKKVLYIISRNLSVLN